MCGHCQWRAMVAAQVAPVFVYERMRALIRPSYHPVFAYERCVSRTTVVQTTGQFEAPWFSTYLLAEEVAVYALCLRPGTQSTIMVNIMPESHIVHMCADHTGRHSSVHTTARTTTSSCPVLFELSTCDTTSFPFSVFPLLLKNIFNSSAS